MTVRIVSPKNPAAPTPAELAEGLELAGIDLSAFPTILNAYDLSCTGSCDRRKPVRWAEWQGRAIVHTCRRNP